MDVAEARKCEVLRRARGGATPGDLIQMDSIAFSACVDTDLLEVGDMGDEVTVTKTGDAFYTQALRRNVGRMEVVGERKD